MTNRIILDDLIATAGANPPVVDSSSMVLKQLEKVDYALTENPKQISDLVRDLLKKVLLAC